MESKIHKSFPEFTNFFSLGSCVLSLWSTFVESIRQIILICENEPKFPRFSSKNEGHEKNKPNWSEAKILSEVEGSNRNSSFLNIGNHGKLCYHLPECS
jgi:hypothetical protein